jgi:hypothetical protein
MRHRFPQEEQWQENDPSSLSASSASVTTGSPHDGQSFVKVESGFMAVMYAENPRNQGS